MLMKNYDVVFQVFAPMARFPTTSQTSQNRNNYRRNWDQVEGLPSLSTITGMISSASGIQWTAIHEDICAAKSLHMVSLNNGDGFLFIDFQIQQYVMSGQEQDSRNYLNKLNRLRRARGCNPMTTRKEQIEFGKPRMGKGATTKIKNVEYDTDIYFLVGLDSKYSDDIERGLKEPRFPLFMGAKSCPLALPTNPIRDISFQDYPIFEKFQQSDRKKGRNPKVVKRFELLSDEIYTDHKLEDSSVIAMRDKEYRSDLRG